MPRGGITGRIEPREPLDPVVMAARNNAEWSDAMCRSHGIVGEFRRDHWTSAVRTIPRYPDAITLEPNVSVAPLLARIDATSPGCSVKDSFADLDLTPFGFGVLFDAEWIGLRSPPPEARSTRDDPFSVVSTSERLDAWERAWGDGEPARTFLPSLLRRDDVVVFGRFVGADVVAGFVANRGGDCVGISNVFADDDHPDWGAVTDAISHRWPALPIVGYESGADLAAAVGQGFVSLGRLRIWVS